MKKKKTMLPPTQNQTGELVSIFPTGVMTLHSWRTYRREQDCYLSDIFEDTSNKTKIEQYMTTHF